jgi:hypothetical protein
MSVSTWAGGSGRRPDLCEPLPHTCAFNGRRRCQHLSCPVHAWRCPPHERAAFGVLYGWGDVGQRLACAPACAQNLPLWQKAVAGLSAGGIGAFVGSPADLTLIRMQVR